MVKRFFCRLIKGIIGITIISSLILGSLIIIGTYSQTQLVEALSDVPYNVGKAIKKISGGFPQKNVIEGPSFVLGYDKILNLEVNSQPLQIEIQTITFEDLQVLEVSKVDESLEVEYVDAALVEETYQDSPVVDATVENVSEVAVSSNWETQQAQDVNASIGTVVDDATAKEWIAQKESGGSYSVHNGIYIGRYQLSSAYLNGDHSPENQERVADEYVLQRYGSWSEAYQFWLVNGWY
ncbi:TPA: hypothetical protein ACGO0I_000142 [Streptococcus suis]